MRGRSLSLMLVLFGALLVGACGSTKPATHSSSGGPAVAFAKCMRAHGVDIPDPSATNRRIQLPAGENPFSTSFKTAQASCNKYGPFGGAPSQASAQQKASMVKLSKCMRRHGVTGFPDPVSSPPSSPAGMALAFGAPGAFIVIPNTIDIQSPVFKHAATTCHLPGT